MTDARTIRAPRGTTLSARSWLTEAPLRMLQNNLDPEVAERPEELVVYGGIGRAARNWECFDRIVETLRRLEDDETLLVQSGKPVGVFRTHLDAPRVLIANSNLVPKWATWEHFNELDRKGLMMFGQMTAGSWIYIGSQGIVQGTYETFAEAGRQHYGGDWSGQVDPDRRPRRHGGRAAARRHDGGRVDARDRVPAVADRDATAHRLPRPARGRRSTRRSRCSQRAAAEKRAVSVGLVGNAAELLPEILKQARAGGMKPALVTDQTSAHDPGERLSARALVAREVGRTLRKRDPDEVAIVGARVDRESRARDPRLPGAWASRASTTATTSARKRRTSAWRTRSTSRASSPRTSGRSSAAAWGRSGGSRSPATRRTSTGPTRRSRSSFPTTAICISGSTWRAAGSSSRACRRGSAGSGSASGTAPGSRSTRWSRRAS